MAGAGSRAGAVAVGSDPHGDLGGGLDAALKGSRWFVAGARLAGSQGRRDAEAERGQRERKDDRGAAEGLPDGGDDTPVVTSAAAGGWAGGAAWP